MWTYSQSSGEFKKDAQLRGVGYSGINHGKNNPLLQPIKSVGPIPRGLWKIGEPYDSKYKGPVCLPLTPGGTTNTFGRSAFLIHGDSKANPGKASHGCIILSRKLRDEIAASDDKELTVTI